MGVPQEPASSSWRLAEMEQARQAFADQLAPLDSASLPEQVRATPEGQTSEDDTSVGEETARGAPLDAVEERALLARWGE